MIHEEISIKTEKASLWTNQTFPKIDPTCNLPSLDQGKSYTDRIYDGPPGEWMPDVGHSETYVHHTLQRSLQLPGTPIRSLQGPSYPQILSPAQKVFGTLTDGNCSSFSISEGTARIVQTHANTVIQNYSNTMSSNHSNALMHNYSSTMTPVSRKLCSPGSATLSRSGNFSNSHVSKFSSKAGDEMDNAYYTYSTTRFKPNSTFR